MMHEGEVVLIYHEDQPAVFARVESIQPDIKKGWYQVTLLLLAIPKREIAWILRDSYMDGDPFTIGGKQLRIEEVKGTTANRGQGDPFAPAKEKSPGKRGQVIPFKKKPG